MLQPAYSIQEIERRLASSIDWNQARIKFLARFLVALISVKTVSLTQSASVLPGEAQAASSYKRIQRFLRHFALDYAALARLVMALVAPEEPWVLAFDRSDWKLGRVSINIPMLVVVHQGVGFPLFWRVLGKAGASNRDERIALLTRFVTTFGTSAVGYVCADREFASRALLSFLLQENLSFRLRIRADTLVENGRGEMVRAQWLFRRCPYGQERSLSGLRQCLGQRLFVVGMRLRGDYLIVISDKAAALSQYALRWGIETLFGCLKSRGFCLEATHVTQTERLERLLALLSVAFVWAFCAGVWRARREPIIAKKHGRPAVSQFRHGFDWLRPVLCVLCGRRRLADLRMASRFLSCT